MHARKLVKRGLALGTAAEHKPTVPELPFETRAQASESSALNVEPAGSGT